MNTPTTDPAGAAVVVPTEPIWPLSVERYHAMVRTGILTADDPVELLEGLLVVKMPKNPPHRLATRLTRLALERVLPPGWHVETPEPVTLPDSEPEPDIAVIRGDARDYAGHHPGPDELALVVEVSDASLGRDRGLKKRLYARAGVTAYWVIDLTNRRVEAYDDPTGPVEGPDYRRVQAFGPDAELPVSVGGVEVGRIPVRELLP
jgi:Uma2 family endonuclease